MSTLAARLDAEAVRRGSQPAVREPGTTWTYAELARASERISRALDAIGVGPGGRAALMLPNSGAFVAAFYAIARLGAAVAPLNPRYGEQELRYYLADAAPAALLVPPEAASLARGALGRLAQPPALVEVAPDGAPRVLDAGRPQPARAGGDGVPLLHQYTSGSTGTPKRVVRTDAMLGLELERLAGALDLDGSDRFLGVAPFTHVNGLVRTMMSAIYVGATVYPLAAFHRRAVLDLIRSERLTCFLGVASMFSLLAETPVRGAVDLSSLRVAFSSSAPLPPRDNRRFGERYGLHVRQLYGSTETGTISANLDPRLDESLESVGRPLPGVRVELVGEDGAAVPHGEEGEIAVASPWAIREYEGNAEATAAAFRAGSYLPGDLGRKRPDGSLALTGRTSFLINRGGFKVNPHEVEQAILTHPKIRRVVVLGAPTPRGDEAVRCVAVASGPCTPAEIVEHCRGLIADFKIPSRIEFRKELPTGPTGKVLRYEL